MMTEPYGFVRNNKIGECFLNKYNTVEIAA